MRVGLWLAAALLLATVAYGLYLFDQAGQFRTVEPLDLACKAVAGFPGAEDIATDLDRRIAVISATDRVGRRDLTWTAGSDGLFAFDLETEQGRPLPVGFDLQPHGISLLETGTEVDWLFVVHHGELTGCEDAESSPAVTRSPHAVVLFDWDGSGVHCRRTVRDELLVNPNDVAGVDAQRFYATNDHGTASPGGQLFDDLRRRRRANVVYWDGSSMRVVAQGIGYANGILVSADGREVFVAATAEGRIRRYEREPLSGDLTEGEAIALSTGVDNLAFDRHGNLWVAAHPKLFSFLAHASDRDKPSPSEVIWIGPNAVPEPKVVPVWRSLGVDGNGLRFSGASVAVPYGARLLIGSVFEPGILICQR